MNGDVLLCRYNNKTYRIDDIAWDQTPNNTFKKGDADVSFLSYYKTVRALNCLNLHKNTSIQLFIYWFIYWFIFLARGTQEEQHTIAEACLQEVIPSTNLVCSQQYNLDITDKRQALLVSHAKKKALPGAPPPGPALLVPELCYLTGLCWQQVQKCARFEVLN